MEKKKGISRRDFLKKAAVGAGVAAAAVTAGKSPLVGKAEAAATINPPAAGIRRAPEFLAALTAPLPKIDFPTTVANVFAMCCKAEGLAAFIHCPGNYDVQSALIEQGIPTYGGRHDGAMGHACDAFYRVSGEIAAINAQSGGCITLGTSPFMIAEGCCSAILICSGAASTKSEDTTMGKGMVAGTWRDEWTIKGVTKWGKTITTPARVWEHTAEAFRQMKTGIPRPVHLLFPSDVAVAKINSSKELQYYFDKSKYRTEAQPYPDPKAIKAAVDLLKAAQRPMIVAGAGVMRSKAYDILVKFAEKTQIPVTECGPQKGKFSDGHPLSASASANCYPSVDVAMLLGTYKMPWSIGGIAYGPDTKYIRIHLEAENIGRDLPIEVGIVSDEKAALEALYNESPPMNRDSWIAEVRKAEAEYEDEKAAMYAQVMDLYKDTVHPAHIGKALADFLQKGKIPRDQTTFVSGGFGVARYVRPYIRAFRPGQILNGPYWEIVVGPDVAYTVGVGMAMELGAGPQAPYKGGPIVTITGDAGVGITAMELETLAKYRIPAVVIVWTNNTWGTWRSHCPADPKATVRNRKEHAHLFQENLRYDMLANALGCYGVYVTNPADFPGALESAYNTVVKERIPCLINCQGKKESLDKRWPPDFWGSINPGVSGYYW